MADRIYVVGGRNSINDTMTLSHIHANGNLGLMNQGIRQLMVQKVYLEFKYEISNLEVHTRQDLVGSMYL